MKNIKYRWKFIKTDEDEKTPVRINIDGESTKCQRKIANKYIQHIQEKINKLTEEKDDKGIDPMKVFEKLISKVEKTFEFTEVRYKDVYKVITSLKLSRAH